MTDDRPLLTAALIVRDEAAFLPACLASLQGVADEIVVVDTGSIDGTPEIAESYGAVVVHHPWNDDFAEARNVSLERATGRWILYIDADERVIAGTRRDLDTWLSDPSYSAHRILLRPMIGSTAYREYRLWRNDPRIRFVGRIHERVVDAIHQVAETDGTEIGLVDLELQHVGYEGDQTHKHRRNLPLLRKRVIEEPDNLFVWHHLSRVLTGLDEADEAERVLEQAVAIAAAQPTVDPTGVLVYTDLIGVRRARGIDVSELLTDALARFPDNCVLRYVDGLVASDHGEFDRAIACFDELLAADPRSFPPSSPSYDEALFGELAHAARAHALFRAGRYAESAEAYAAAEALAPTNPAHAVKRQLAEAKAARAALA